MLKDDIVSEVLKRVVREIKEKIYKGFVIPKLKLDLKGYCAGLAVGESHLIRINPLIKGKKNLLNVLRHEALHLLDFHLNGKMSHRGKWKEWMLLLGADPSAKHSLDLKPATKKCYTYRCSCGIFHFTPSSHKKALSGVEYHCGKCGDLFLFVGK
jgi:predicted SprT family Zn-dependent metalloprotease